MLASAIVLVAVVGAVTSCGGGSDGAEPSTPTTPEEQGPFPVETLSETFVDERRPTEDPAGTRTAATRTLETDIYVPDGEGPFPLIVHAHGFDGNPGKFTELLTHWAEAGYVVVAPKFPLTNDLDGVAGVLDDYVNQPADVAFVVDEVLRLASGEHPTLAGRHF